MDVAFGLIFDVPRKGHSRVGRYGISPAITARRVTRKPTQRTFSGKHWFCKPKVGSSILSTGTSVYNGLAELPLPDFELRGTMGAQNASDRGPDLQSRGIRPSKPDGPWMCLACWGVVRLAPRLDTRAGPTADLCWPSAGAGARAVCCAPPASASRGAQPWFSRARA
jgi:hypothetical protein